MINPETIKTVEEIVLKAKSNADLHELTNYLPTLVPFGTETANIGKRKLT